MLDLSEEDVDSIQKKNRRQLVIASLITPIVAFIGIIMGFLLGKGQDPSRNIEISEGGSGGYPYNMGFPLNPIAKLGGFFALPLTAMISSKGSDASPTSTHNLPNLKLKLISILTIVLSVIIAYFGFRYMYDLSQPEETIRIIIEPEENFGGAIDYGVFSN